MTRYIAVALAALTLAGCGGGTAHHDAQQALAAGSSVSSYAPTGASAASRSTSVAPSVTVTTSSAVSATTPVGVATPTQAPTHAAVPIAARTTSAPPAKTTPVPVKTTAKPAPVKTTTKPTLTPTQALVERVVRAGTTKVDMGSYVGVASYGACYDYDSDANGSVATFTYVTVRFANGTVKFTYVPSWGDVGGHTMDVPIVLIALNDGYSQDDAYLPC